MNAYYNAFKNFWNSLERRNATPAECEDFVDTVRDILAAGDSEFVKVPSTSRMFMNTYAEARAVKPAAKQWLDEMGLAA